MKKLHILLLWIVPSLLLLGSACVEQEVVYPNQGDSLNAAFSVASKAVIVKSSDGGVLTVDIVRGNLIDTDADVGISLTTGADVPASANFRLASNTVHFAKGEKQKTIPINYDFNGLDLFETYPVTLSFTDPKQGPLYGANATSTLQVKREVILVYEDYGIGEFDSEFFDEVWDVEVEKAQGAPYFILKDCYFTGYPIEFVLTKDLKKVDEFKPKQPIGYVHPSYGMVSVSLVDYYISGKTVHFLLSFTIPDGRTFGNFEEIVTLP
jgi:hypothetical protein